MVTTLRHPEWHFVAEHKFRRRAAITSVMQRLRGRDWLVLYDALSGQSLRLDAKATALWNGLDGRRTMDVLWRDLSRQPTTAASQGDLVNWLLQLVTAGLILSDHRLDAEHLSHRGEKKQDQAVTSKAANPLAIKLPLFDPKWLLRVTYPLVSWVFSTFGALIVIAVLLAGSIAAAMNWSALTSTADNVLLTQSGLFALFLSYPIMKLLHELGHGWVVHHYGGEVREAGVMFLLFVPIPYVDASAATTFPDYRHRMLVGAAGIVVELLIAAICLLAWLVIEPGVEKAILYSFVIMGTLSTVLFNGNPLLKFDAYYVLSDWLQTPNLATRSARHLADLMHSRLFGLRQETNVPSDEARILFSYGVASLVYKLMLTLFIVLVISTQFYILGILLAVWSVVTGLIWPVIKTMQRGWNMAGQQNRRRRYGLRSTLIGLGVIGVFGFVPLPFAAMGEGQITPRPESLLIAEANGVIEGAIAQDGKHVREGASLLEMSHPQDDLQVEMGLLRLATLQEKLSRGALPLEERRRLQADENHLRTYLNQAEERAALRILRAPHNGVLAWRNGRPPVQGSFVTRGEPLGYVISAGSLDILAAFPPAYAGMMSEAGGTMEILLPDGQTKSVTLEQFRVLDKGALVPESLLSATGGSVPGQPNDPSRALAPVLVVWATSNELMADHAFLRFDAKLDLEPRPLAAQAVFHIYRLFLRATRV